MISRKGIIISTIIAFVMLLLSYWVTNLDISISGEKQVINQWEGVKSCLNLKKNRSVPDSIMFVNTSFDKELVDTIDQFGNYVGNRPITNRHKLLSFLQKLYELDSRGCHYKYVLLDVNFREGISTDADRELFNLIIKMNRVIIPYHGARLAEQKLLNKAGHAEYFTTKSESDFVKYPYLSKADTIPSIPLKMYEEITGRKIHKYGILYFDGWHLARKSTILTFEALPQQDDWINLGSEILDSCNDSSIPSDELAFYVEKSYIVIGSMDDHEDLHQTYIGEVSGSVINMNAYLSLMNGHHRTSICVGLILFLVFFVYAYMVFERKSLTDYFCQIMPMKNRKATISMEVLVNLMSMIAFSSVMSILCIVIYEVFDEVYDIVITATVFQIIDFVLRLINKQI